MFIGHFAVALAAKKSAPKASLGTLFFAAQLVDLVWPILVLAGIEVVRIAPGITAFTPLDFEQYPISHSMAGAIAWSLLLGAGYYALRKQTRESVVLCCLVFSHWLLDLLTHRPDLQLLPGVDYRVGLGLWNSVAATVIVEVGLFATGVFLYLRSTRAKDRTGAWALYGLLAFLAVIYAMNILSPPPPGPEAIGYAGLAMWLFIPWGWWIDRHRE
jgi:hypothetical protein